MADQPLSEHEQHRRRQAVKGIFPATPFMGLLGITFDRYEPDDVVVRLPFHEQLTNDGEVNWRCFSVVMTAATAVSMSVVMTVSMGRFMRMVMFRMIMVARFVAGVFVNFLSMVVGTTA